MIGEEIRSCKSHIPSDSLTNWCLKFFSKKKKELNPNIYLHKFDTLTSVSRAICGTVCSYQ